MSDVKTQLTLHDRNLTLHRYPKRNNETLQAWDAGDEYLINYVEEQAGSPRHILILNDSFGALTCWFAAQHKVSMMSDSFLAHSATRANLAQNGELQADLLTATDSLPDDIDLVLMQIPKNNRYLTWQLHQLRTRLPADCPVVAVNKAREIHTSTLKLFEKYLGSTTTSLAWKKHRLVFSTPDCTPLQPVDPVTRWQVDGHPIELDNLPNVYSGESLDLGARFMLQYIPQDEVLAHIIDLGCGNGVLSVKAAQLNPQASVTSVDESYMAIESARRNLAANCDTNDAAGSNRFNAVANNCLDGFTKGSADLVLCNPPFHQQYAITDHIAWQMFCDAKHVLGTGGKLMVIGNRHLGYDVKLRRLFGQNRVKVIASNKKFVILQATN
jgi:16S rRNA (guanine1207-N2)-methyltransferase